MRPRRAGRAAAIFDEWASALRRAGIQRIDGAISNARALSGYVRSRDGEVVAFSILANGFVIPAATVNDIADLAVETLANYSRRRVEGAATADPSRPRLSVPTGAPARARPRA